MRSPPAAQMTIEAFTATTAFGTRCVSANARFPVENVLIVDVAKPFRLIRVKLAISFGERVGLAEDVVHAFRCNRQKIEHAARRMLQEVGKKPVILHSGYLRFCE